MSYPARVQANVNAVVRMGHKVVSQGCAMFRCTRCNTHGFLDVIDNDNAELRRSCKAVHYRSSADNGYAPAICGVRGGRIADGHHKNDVTCHECLTWLDAATLNKE